MHDAKQSAAGANGRRDYSAPEPTSAGLPGGYPAFLAQLKDRIAAA